MNMIYCRKNTLGTLDFFVTSPAGECFLFSQKYYPSVYEKYKRPITVKQATDHKRAERNTILLKVISKLPVYLKYAEKYDSYVPEKKRKRNFRERYSA